MYYIKALNPDKTERPGQLDGGGVFIQVSNLAKLRKHPRYLALKRGRWSAGQVVSRAVFEWQVFNSRGQFVERIENPKYKAR